MQVYIKPYPYQTVANVPYAAEKLRNDGTRNHGYFDVKKYPGKLKSIPEIKDAPELATLIERINKHSRLTTFGCDYNKEPVRTYFQQWSFINLHFDDMNLNESDGEYLKLLGDFLYYSSNDNQENAIVEYILSPTNYHDLKKFKKGAKPNAKTVLFQGWSLNCKVIGVGGDYNESEKLWKYGMEQVTSFLT